MNNILEKKNYIKLEKENIILSNDREEAVGECVRRGYSLGDLVLYFPFKLVFPDGSEELLIESNTYEEALYEGQEYIKKGARIVEN